MSLPPEEMQRLEEVLKGSSASTLRLREALWFLAIAYQPVTLLELWTYIQIRLGLDAQDGNTASQVDDATSDAISELCSSLGQWVLIRNPTDGHEADIGEDEHLSHGKRYLVELREPLFRRVMLEQMQNSKDLGNQGDGQRTSRCMLAHADTAIICLKIATTHFGKLICSRYYSMQAHEPPLVQYSFQFWYSHIVESKTAKNDELMPLVQKFRDELIRKSVSLLGSISLTIDEDQNDLRRSKGEITRSAGIVALRSACLCAARSLEELSGLSFELAFRTGRQLKPLVKPKDSSKKQLAIDLLNSMSTEYNRWARKNYLSSIAHDILNTDLVPISGDPAYEIYANQSVTTTQDLYALACELSINPVRWELINPEKDFSPVVPFLMAGQALESIMLWPATEYLKLDTDSPWKAQGKNEQLHRLSYAVEDISHAPSNWETISQRSQEAAKSYTITKSNVLAVCWNIVLNHGSSHVNSAVSYFQRSGLQARAQAAIDMLKGVLSVPATLLLFLYTNISRFLSWFWLTFIWSTTLLRTSYNQLFPGPWTMWRHHKFALLGGFGLYLLRSRLFPSFGQHWSPNAYHQIQTAITNPLAWIVRQNELTWLSYIWHEGEMFVLFSFASVHANMQQSNFPLWTKCLRVLFGFYEFLYFERIICQIVNAVLTVAVPIMVALQFEAARPATASGFYLNQILYKASAGMGYKGVAAAIIRIFYPIVLWSAASSYSLLANLVTFYTAISMIPISLVVTAWGLLIVFEEVKYYPPVFEDSANLLQLCVIIAVVLFVGFFLKEDAPRNPQRYLDPSRKLSKTVEISRKITNVQVVGLSEFIKKEGKSVKEQ